ncbi:MAG TPA: hypothetical protein VFA79_14615 [Myxococcales bacterium]|nr:hypothetical protein [Myxococcales bacterium]
MRGRVLAAAGLALAACASEKPAIKTSSSPRPPAWMAKAPASGESLYFTGGKEGAGSLDEGKASAVESARSQAAQYIGVEISAEHRDVMSTEEAENMARDTVRSRANAMLRSAEVADVYYEKISREVGAGTVDRYDVWVLLKLPRAEVEKERQRQAQEAQQAAAAAAARFREGRALEAQGDLIGALVRYRDALAKTKDLAGATPTGDRELATASALAQKAQDAATAARSKARRAIVVAPDWVAGAVAQALARQGFTAQMPAGAGESAALAQAKAQGTPWVIVVHATTTPGGKVFAQVAATAALDVRALDARSGAVVASTQKQAKGVGRTPEAAQQAAVSEAGLGAGNEVAAALVAKENAGP